ncbi:YbjN domain-containing protein [Hymenobacter lutimineralis]|uniref:YbjN domain-containing protein n=1 Tax=Hymenobacter lutimineralis TaxID=2606448 RepID=A0A5D6VB36_9BACT|nr:YbjN domain-containing protein [Hymenobacter lutimineralis]TYZ12517.1 YbjN domain-containing protein [Hymenobacter lutimineralis]
MPSWTFLLHVLAFVGGALLVLSTLLAAIRSFVLPRNESVLITNWVFRSIRFLFSRLARLKKTYGSRDRVMALYAPVALVTLPAVWLVMVGLGYTAIFWALGEGDFDRCFRISNSSLFTLGSEEPSKGFLPNAVSYSEAGLGLLLVTLLISYLPTMYQAFSRRELVVARLELRAGAPASAVTLLEWLHRAGALQHDGVKWEEWESWFVEIEESHTSLGILAFFRSPQPGRSWVMAADIILDAAALLLSTVAAPRNPHGEICFKAGCISINRVYRYFEGAHANPEALPKARIEEPSGESFREAYAQLRAQGIPLEEDVEVCWHQYQELRSRYQPAIAYLGQLTMTPEIKAF